VQAIHVCDGNASQRDGQPVTQTNLAPKLGWGAAR
jgi:hypothetical protein